MSHHGCKYRGTSERMHVIGDLSFMPLHCHVRLLYSTSPVDPDRSAPRQRSPEAANEAFDRFLEKYQAKYDAACECLSKDRDVLMTFYDFPAEHWKHLRTTNPIESTFSTIRLRHRRTKGSGTRRTSLAMMFKLAQSAEARWRRLNGHEQIVHLLQGKKFLNRIRQDAA